MTSSVCQAITRRSASNLALGFVLLPREQRQAMATLYAFCREVDDVADETALPVADRQRALERWRQDVDTLYGGGPPQFPVNRELQPIVQRYRLPREHFEELLRGVGMDLERHRYASPADLEVYCYRVASVVGLLSIEIFGYRAPACREYAVHLGKALQLTNILRDVRADAERDRIYLPLEDLHRFGVEPDEVLRHQYSDRFRALANAVADRARSFYRRAREVLPDGDRPAMVAAELMGTIYWRLLEKLARANFNVLGPIRPGVTKAEKLLLVARTWWRFKLGSTAPNYGPP